MDLISVIIPTYNRGKLIRKSVMSVLNQTYTNIEIIIVDDGSTDNTESVIKKINDPRIKYIKYKKNRGACYARNYGIKIAKGKYIAFHDSDDEFISDKLEKQLNNLLKNESDLDFCRVRVCINQEMYEWPIIDPKDMKGDWILDRICKGNIITTAGIIAKKEIFNDILFDEALPRLQDYDLAIRIVTKYKTSFTNEVLLNGYRSNDSISNSDEKLKKACLRMLCRDYGLNEKQHENLVKDLIRLYDEKMWGELQLQKQLCHELESEHSDLINQNEQLRLELDAIINSKRWKMLSRILKIFGK